MNQNIETGRGTKHGIWLKILLWLIVFGPNETRAFTMLAQESSLMMELFSPGKLQLLHDIPVNWSANHLLVPLLHMSQKKVGLYGVILGYFLLILSMFSNAVHSSGRFCHCGERKTSFVL